MSAITFDSLEFVETLTKAGVPEAQAKAEAKAIGNAFKQITDSKELATKQDISISEFKIRQEMAELKSELLRAMLLQTFAITGLVIAVVKFVG
jgi:ribosomal protein L5